MSVRTVIVKQPEPTFADRIYLVEVLRGLGLTAGHFFLNLKAHILKLLFRIETRTETVTIQYPEERRPSASRLRTRHRLTLREDGSTRCVACMMCETSCPARCIYIVAGDHPDPNIEKYPVQFKIDIGKCVFCGFCVEACPEDAIHMDTGVLELASYTREGMIFHKEQLMMN
jgi:NADH-quinone oxidoreductase subunit I